ncbi:MAG: LacI family transcriptional regulator [Lentisphaeria bacterium]|nr:LacI family transcriptional regulator [Lentisphaeria bacterium]
MPVTLKDLAMLIGVSRQAVAAALEDGGSGSRVSARTREKVRKLARELNYVPNAAARKLRGGSGRTVGILASPGMALANAVYAEVCQILRSRGYTCLTVDHAMGELPTLCHQLSACGVDGIVVMDAGEVPGKALRLPDLPIVFCRGRAGGTDLDVDKELTGCLATAHLLAHGHERVHYLTVSTGPGTSLRQQGWARALKEAGRTGMVIELRKLDGSAERLDALLRREKATALFCSNDFIAGKVMRVLTDRNWRIPDDIAVVGCDGHSFVEFTRPALTSVIQPVHALAERCADMLLERIERRIHGVILEGAVIPPRLWIGGSCGCPDRKPETVYRLDTTGNLEKDFRSNLNSSLWPD